MTQPRIKDLPEEERPRERLIKFGPDKLPEAQLLAILLRTGGSTLGQSAQDLGRGLIKNFGGLQALDTASVTEICAIPGIGKAKAAFELGKRFISAGNGGKAQFTSSQEVANRYIPWVRNAKKETFRSLLLDVKNSIVREMAISEGCFSASIVHPREVFAPAIKESAAFVTFAHNHPSEDPSPSPEDLEITHRLVGVGNLVGITVLDHIIVGDIRYFSYRDENLLSRTSS